MLRKRKRNCETKEREPIFRLQQFIPLHPILIPSLYNPELPLFLKDVYFKDLRFLRTVNHLWMEKSPLPLSWSHFPFLQILPLKQRPSALLSALPLPNLGYCSPSILLLSHFLYPSRQQLMMNFPSPQGMTSVKCPITRLQGQRNRSYRRKGIYLYKYLRPLLVASISVTRVFRCL